MPQDIISNSTAVNSPQKMLHTKNEFAVANSPSYLREKNKPYTSDSTSSLSLKVHISAHSRLKRCLDILGACIGLSVFALLLPIVALAIALDSKGPIFYSQKRCGLKGQPFQIWKLRSMVVDADRLKGEIQNEAKGLIFKNKNDPRITSVGRFLRKTSLDEFPQFWNVLKGEMSLVGTRPPTLDETAQYSPHHWLRLQVKPGITGEWQAKGRSQVDDFEAIVAMDLRYQSKWSVGYDLQLIWATIGAVIQRRGAC